MYYRLKAPFAFRGWKKLPFAIQAQYGPQKHETPLFMKKIPFIDLLSCNGEEDVDLSAFSEEGRQTLQKLLSDDIIEQSATALPPLENWQRYRVFPSRYLSSILWSVTGKCNFRCRHCLISAPGARHPQLPLSDCMHIIEEIADCGVRHVDLSGGEPLVRADFEEIVKALTLREIDIGIIFTNASLLTKDTLDMLKKYNQFPAFQLSFDGLGRHDWLRGINGAEKQADTAFRLLQQYHFPVIASMCLHRGNKDRLRETVNYLAGLGVQTLRVSAPQNLGVWKQYSSQYALSAAELWSVFREYIACYFEDGMPMDIELGGFFQCKKGRTDYTIKYADEPAEPAASERSGSGNPTGPAEPVSNDTSGPGAIKASAEWSQRHYCESMQYQAYISPEGRLIPCMGFADTTLGEKFPSILQEHLGELTLDSYYHDVTDTKVTDYLAENPGCKACEHLPQCRGGCMVEGITDEGDYLVPDQTCCYFYRHVGEDAVRRIADTAIKNTAIKDTAIKDTAIKHSIF